MCLEFGIDKQYARIFLIRKAGSLLVLWSWGCHNLSSKSTLPEISDSYYLLSNPTACGHSLLRKALPQVGKSFFDFPDTAAHTIGHETQRLLLGFRCPSIPQIVVPDTCSSASRCSYPEYLIEIRAITTRTVTSQLVFSEMPYQQKARINMFSVD